MNIIIGAILGIGLSAILGLTLQDKHDPHERINVDNNVDANEWHYPETLMPNNHQTIIIQPYANVNAGVPVVGYYDRSSDAFYFWEYDGTYQVNVSDVSAWRELPTYSRR